MSSHSSSRRENSRERSDSRYHSNNNRPLRNNSTRSTRSVAEQAARAATHSHQGQTTIKVTRYVYTTAGDYGIGNMEPADQVHSEGDCASDQRVTVPMDCDEEYHEVKQSSERATDMHFPQVPVTEPGSLQTMPGAFGAEPTQYQSPETTQEQTSAQKSGQEYNDTDSRGDSRAGGSRKDAAKKRNENSHGHAPGGEDNHGYGHTILKFVGVSTSSSEEKRLMRLNADLNIRNQKIEKKYNDFHTKNEQLSGRIQELEQLANIHMTTINRQKQEIKVRDDRLAQFADEQQGLEDQIRTAQLAMSKRSARPKVDLVDDERTIKGNFMNLHDEVRKWSKAWGSANFSIVDNLSGEDKEKFLEQLGKVVALEGGQVPHALRASDMTTRSSILCVSAMLGRYLCAHVIEAPFRPIRPLVTRTITMPPAADQDETIQQESSKQKKLVQYEDDTLSEVYRKLSCLNQARAQIWRSDILSILDPKPSDGASEETYRAQEDAANRRRQTAAELTADFLDSRVTVLLPPVEPEDVAKRHEQLRSIFQTALDISGRLWKQLTIVKCSYLEDLNHESFTYESDLMDAHAFHKLGLDDESENRLNHHKIRIVCFPTIKGYGSSSGENYHQDRVWGKAIVWLDE